MIRFVDMPPRAEPAPPRRPEPAVVAPVPSPPATPTKRGRPRKAEKAS